VSSVLLGIDDPSAARELTHTLEAAGYSVGWVGALDITPGPGRATPDILLIDGDAPGMDLAVVAAAWKRREPPPALVVLGTTQTARTQAGRVNAPILAKPVDREHLLSELARIEAGARGDKQLNPASALRALSLVGGGLPEDEAALIVSGGRQIDVAMVREALRPYMYSYAIPTPLVERLLARRSFAPIEAKLAVSLDGGRTVRGAIDGLPRAEDDATPIGSLSSHQVARVIWALASSGAVSLQPEPPPHHRTGRLRAHIRARKKRLHGANSYQVLDLNFDATPGEIARATVLAEMRYGPMVLEEQDLGDLAAAANLSWEQIARARMVLGDPRLRADYDASLIARHSELEEYRATRRIDTDEAERHFVRGQQFLGAGDIFRAVSELAAAARKMPGRADYEAYAAWARFLADEQRGSDRRLTASRERQIAEESLAGRLPWPRASYALGLLCEAAGDIPAATTYMREALQGDEKLVPARQALARMQTESP
jgi:CheY-like chemotaxis protein